MYEPNVVYEVVARTIHARFLLRPSKAVNSLLVGILGRAQELFPSVNVYFAVVLSNHFHWLISSPHPEQIPEFIGYFKGRVSWELGKLHDWPGSFWESLEATPILDNKAMVNKFRYLLAQGCKEGLVESPLDWPGVTCVHAILDQRAVRGTWIDRVGLGMARRRDPNVRLEEFATDYELEIQRLPCWRSLSSEQYRRAVKDMVERIEADTRRQYPRDTNPVLGAEKVMAMHPHHRPEEPASKPAPLCHTTDPRKRRAYRLRVRRFAEGFHAAAVSLAAGVREVDFPLFSFPPRSPMVLPTAPLACVTILAPPLAFCSS